MTVSANRRDFVVAVVAAALGGSAVAGAFAATSFLRECQSRAADSESCPSASTDPESSQNNFTLNWIRRWLRRAFIKLDEGNKAAGIDYIRGTSKNWGSTSRLSGDGLDAKDLSFGSLAQTSRSCDREAAFGGLGQGPVNLSPEEQVESCWKSANSRNCNANVMVDPFNPSKRERYLSWDDYFMAIAFLSAQRSKDPNRQVGACLVSQDQVILGIGYNGFPRGCSDDELPWAKMSVDSDPLKTKYPYVCHAEVNAILNKNHASACGQRLYVTMFPCNECAKVIIQARIAEVAYFTDKGQGQSNNVKEASFVASRKLLAMAGVKVWQHKPLKQALVLEYQ